MRKPLLIALLLILGITAQGRSLLPAAHAVEPVQAFASALRQRHMYEEAVWYLEQLESQPSSADLQPLTTYELGVTLATSAEAIADLKAKQNQTERAIEKLKAFVTRYENHELIGSANNELGSALVADGRIKAAYARQPDAPKGNSLLAAARARFEDARPRFAAAEKLLGAKLAKLPKLVTPEETELRAIKDRLASDLAQAQLMSASVDFELAGTLEPGSAEAKKLLKASATRFASLAENYRTRGAGLYAMFWEGRAYQELGDLKQALGCYRELMEMPDSKEPHSFKARLRLQSTRRALECLVDPRIKGYAEARERGEEWIKTFSGSEAQDADALAIRYLTALAARQEIPLLPTKDTNRKRLGSIARLHLAAVVKQPGEYQQPARSLLVQMGVKPKEEADAAKDPTTFVGARDLGKEALERMDSAAMTQKIDPNSDPTLAAEQETARIEALRHFRTALRLADKSAKLEDLNTIRYYLCYLYWDLGEYLDASVLGEYLAQNFPDTQPGREGATIALAAYVKLYGEATQADKQFEMDGIQRMAELIIKRWPDQRASHDAAQTLMAFAVQQGDYAKAVEYLARIPADSEARGQAELKAGQSLWAGYLKASQADGGDKPKPETVQLKKQAKEILEQGIARMRKQSTVSDPLVSAVLSLSQILIDTGDPEKAIQWLEDKKIGPRVLVDKNDPLTQREGFTVETYKAALRAYVAAKKLKDAEEVMDSLEKTVGNDPKASETLTLIYISLGRELQQQLQELRKSGKQSDLDSISQAFETFLSRIVAREKGNNYSSLNWVAETFYSLGSGFDEGGPKASARARKYFEQARVSYQRILTLAEKDPKFAPQAESLTGVRLRMAVCLRRLGNYNDAVKLLADVLTEKPMMLVAQMQAAETYQAWGAVKPLGYVRAIKGGHPGKDGKDVIWGWSKISQVTLGNPKFDAEFFQARLKQAECRFLYGLAEDNEALLKAAKQDLWFTYKHRADLGGADSYEQYDRLIKRIQKSLKEEPKGLKEFKDRETTAASAKTENG